MIFNQHIHIAIMKESSTNKIVYVDLKQADNLT